MSKYTSEFLSKCPFSSAMLSDACDDLNVPAKVFSKEFKANFIQAKISGLVRTINVVKHNGLDSRLYDSLKIFEILNEKDIVAVGNDQPDLAFWGELNTRLAVRSGAQGAVVGSVTRDSDFTIKSCFPVFSIGNRPIDVRGRAIVQSIDKQTVIDNILITSGDWILGDNDGLILIPNKDINKVYEYTNKIYNKEKDIVKAIDEGMPALEIHKKYGNF